MHSRYFVQLLFLAFLFPSFLSAQSGEIFGTITDAYTAEPLIGASVSIEDTNLGTITDYDGNYVLESPTGKQEITISYTGYESSTQLIDVADGGRYQANFSLSETAAILQTATVTSGRYEKPLGEVTVSLEVLKPALLENTNQTSIDGALEKLPGVSIVDGQPNIRGGSGFSYGAGSRVLLLVDDIPILQSDAGLPNWDDVPIENIEQIEVVKGAASALYGSAAMNGIINVRTGFARSEPITQMATFTRFYLQPRNRAAQWWGGDNDVVPNETGFSLKHARKIGNLDLILSGFYLNETSFERDNFDRYGRFTTSLRYRFNDRLSIQVNSNYNRGRGQSYFFWGGLDSLQYTGAPDVESITNPERYNIDPSLTYYTLNGDRHRVLARIYGIDNQNNANRSNSSNLFYGEYQFLRKWEALDLVFTAGGVGQTTRTEAELFGDTIYRSRNFATYAQLDKKLFGKLNLSAGARWEHNTLLTPEMVGGEMVPNEGRITENRPVFRFGANYQSGKQTYFRASWGQGYRYPTVAETFITTQLGPIPIIPNPDLQSETGWSAEVAVKHGFKIGSFGAYVDLAAFWSEYQDMMEFNAQEGGFASINVGDTRIRGLELGFGGQGKLFGGMTNIIAGYTFIDPRFLEWDTDVGGRPFNQGELNFISGTTDVNILKYRSQHSAKLDVETVWGAFSFGVSGIYNSRIDNIDQVFELIIPGLNQFRMDETGYLLAGLRTAYRFEGGLKLSLLCDNLLNQAYATRPGLLAAPRSVSARVDFKF
ncbi:MAG: TonB-dependent receptor [Bacteroidota bacterium]